MQGIITHKDQYYKRGKMMNESLNKTSLSKAILFTDRGNINKSTYINYGGLHLRTRSSKIFGKNILNVEKKLGVSD